MSGLDELIKYYDNDTCMRYFNINLIELYKSVKGLLVLRKELHKILTTGYEGNRRRPNQVEDPFLLTPMPRLPR